MCGNAFEDSPTNSTNGDVYLSSNADCNYLPNYFLAVLNGHWYKKVILQITKYQKIGFL